MSDEHVRAEEVWWVMKPAEPSRMAKLLHRMRLRSLPHASSHTEHLPLTELDSVRDERLRAALARQAAHGSEKSIIVPVAHSDGTLIQVNSVRRGSLGFDNAEPLQDN